VEARLEEKGDTKRLAEVRRTSELADIFTVRQGEPLGLGHAVGTAASHVGDNAFAVLLGDEFVEVDKPLLPQMLDLQARTGGIVLAFMEVKPEETSRYGIAVVEPSDEGDDIVKVTGLVEKPAPEDAPSNLAVIGRYVLHPRIFDVLKDTKPGRGGEIQLTDALQELAQRPDEPGGGVYGVIFSGRRYDTGDRLDYLKAVVQLASERADLGPDLRVWLRGFVAGLADEPVDELKA
jgi:UTP--glucose-1-phosphate uridylyltransferase